MALKEQDGEQQYAVICANDGSVEREREREREMPLPSFTLPWFSSA